MRDQTHKVSIPTRESLEESGTYTPSFTSNLTGARCARFANRATFCRTQRDILCVKMDRGLRSSGNPNNLRKRVVLLSQRNTLLLKRAHVPPDGIEPSSADYKSDALQFS